MSNITGNSAEVWYQGIEEARAESGATLSDFQHQYLLLTLASLIRKPQIARAVCATAYLKALASIEGSAKKQQSREVGDICLIYAGLYPERARRKGVSLSYFPQLGQAAYEESGLPEIAEGFLELVEVLLAFRPMSSYNLETIRNISAGYKSSYARKLLKEVYGQNVVVMPIRR